MHKIYQKLLFLLPLIALALPVNATAIIVDYQGDTVVQPMVTERRLVVNCSDDGVYDIAVKPLETEIRSIDGKYSIPLSNLYINNNREDVYMRYNEYSNIFFNTTMGGIPQNMTAKIRDYGMVPAGIYGITFEIQAVDSQSRMVEGTSTFRLEFVVPVVQKLRSGGTMSKISMGVDEITRKVSRLNNEVSPTIYINSNADWVLLLKTNDFDSTHGNYYVRTISASSGVNERLQDRVLITPMKEIILAKGKAPANGQYVTIEYSMDTKDGKIVNSGIYENRVRYVLREDRG